MMQLNEAVAGTGSGIAGAMCGAAASSLYPEMRFSWEIKSVDALFCNGMYLVFFIVLTKLDENCHSYLL